MKRIILLMLVLCFCMPMQAFAHSKLTEATPAVDAMLQQSPEAIEMKFNTAIASMSTFTLTNQNGEELEIADITVNDDMLSGKVVHTLENGLYTVNWTIIGADGHTVPGNYTFTVEAPITEATPPASEGEAEQNQDDLTNEDSKTDQEENAASNETDTNASTNSEITVESDTENKTKQNIVPFILIGLIIVGAIALAIRKRK